MSKLQTQLLTLSDKEHADFSAKLSPKENKDRFLGVKMGELRKLAKAMTLAERDQFVNEVPHQYYEEDMIHVLLIKTYQKREAIIQAIERFSPYLTSWSLIDSLASDLKLVQKDLNGWRPFIDKSLSDQQPFIKRLGIVLMLIYYLDEGFKASDLIQLSKIKTGEYYVDMALAWYYSFAIIKQPKATIPFLKENHLTKFVHNKTIQKARESRRLTAAQKDLLLTLKR